MKVMSATMARSRSAITVLMSMESSSVRVSAALSTGVLPWRTECFGPRTELAGLVAMTWPTTSQSKSIRMPARCCFTDGAASERCSCSM